HREIPPPSITGGYREEVRTTTMSPAEAGKVRGDLAELLESGGGGDDPASVERLAATFLAIGQVPDVGDELIEAALEALEEAGDTHAASVLSALAKLAREPLAGRADAALTRLGHGGVRAGLEGSIGTLAVVEAKRLDLGGAEMLVALLRRSGDRRAQAAMVIVEQEETGGAAIEGDLMPPDRHRSLDGVLRQVGRRFHVKVPRTTSLTAGELTEAMSAAVARSAELGLTVSLDLATALPILALALAGDAGAFAPVLVDGGHDLPIDPKDDAELEAASSELAEHLVEVAVGDPVIERSGAFVVQTMLDYKWRYGDRRIASWTTADLDDYLLDYFPRKVSADRELVSDTPACVAGFLGLLDNHDALEGDPVQDLVAHLEDIATDFGAAVTDRGHWGIAKTVVMGMADDGVDPDDPAAMAAWVGGFNARPRPERERLLGDVGHPASPRGVPRRGADAGSARAKRKAARSSRRRNRR
ncbi:MAG: hypothetical protein ACRDZQ_10615, partial [Acidimicrobiales bacterium]